MLGSKWACISSRLACELAFLWVSMLLNARAPSIDRPRGWTLGATFMCPTSHSPCNGWRRAPGCQSSALLRFLTLGRLRWRAHSRTIICSGTSVIQWYRNWAFGLCYCFPQWLCNEWGWFRWLTWLTQLRTERFMLLWLLSRCRFLYK